MTFKAKEIVKTPSELILVILFLILIETKATKITLSNISESVIKSLTNCDEKNDTLSVCLKKRSLLLLDKYSRATDTISLMSNSLTLVKDSDATNLTETSRSLNLSGLTQEKLDKYLPIEEKLRQKVLDNLIVSSVSKFLQSRSLQIKLPQFLAQFIGSGLSEGRGKKADKYYGAFILGAMLVAGTLIPIKMGTLALMSGKALMTSMLALTLAGIVALKKLSSDGKSPSTTTYEVINVPAGHSPHGHSGRSLPLSSTIPSDLAATTLHPKVNQQGAEPYSAYKTQYVYDSGNSNGESDYI